MPPVPSAGVVVSVAADGVSVSGGGSEGESVGSSDGVSEGGSDGGSDGESGGGSDGDVVSVDGLGVVAVPDG
ncbi:hypothetical protein ACFVQF_35370, partial [Streptomyces sp. NPDC057866]|uniref:hypothetical protein n=1 Tax=Streptomyces sp. NPDC057866 TaxID=3346268 RepID=UPI0036B83483